MSNDSTDDLTRRKAEADLASAEADVLQKMIDADAAAAKARREQVKAMVPDLSAVKASTVETKDATPMWGGLLAFGALKEVASDVVDSIASHLNGSSRVLVTSESDLASADAVYGDVHENLDRLELAAKTVLDDTTPSRKGPSGQTLEDVLSALADSADVRRVTSSSAGSVAVESGVLPLGRGAGVASVVAPAATALVSPGAALLGGLADVLPGVLSLFSAHRVVSTGKVDVGDLAAAAAVAGALVDAKNGPAVVHDTLRLASPGATYKKVAALAGKQRLLLERKLELASEQAALKAELAEAKAAPSPSEKEVGRLTEAATVAATRLGIVKTTLDAIDTYMAAIRTVPKGGKTSFLTTAALHDGLHGSEPSITHVLLVKAHGGKAQEDLDDRPLFFDDKFSTFADISITYMLMETRGSAIVAAATVTRVAGAHGKVGSRPTFELSSIRPTAQES